ncbi:hypothetical protein hairong_042 [Pseudomonas phage hairong]|nr:hypothetical protein hairong_042 [Pseudomonas phage hairong]
MQDQDKKVIPFDRDRKNKKPLDTRNGHETILKGFIVRREPIALNLMNGKMHIGLVTQFDNYTITIKLETGQLRTFYKHCIESFNIVQV